MPCNAWTKRRRASNSPHSRDKGSVHPNRHPGAIRHHCFFPRMGSATVSHRPGPRAQRAAGRADRIECASLRHCRQADLWHDPAHRRYCQPAPRLPKTAHRWTSPTCSARARDIASRNASTPCSTTSTAPTPRSRTCLWTANSTGWVADQSTPFHPPIVIGKRIPDT